MGMTAHLQLHKTKIIDPFDRRAKILFERKVFIAFGWFLFFTPGDLQVFRGAEASSNLLVVNSRTGLARAKRRVKAIGRVGTARLLGGLTAYLDSIGRAGAGWLVLDSYRLNASKAELIAPLKWLEALEASPTLRKLARGDALFEADDEGPRWEDEEGARAMDCGALEDIVGWPIRAPNVKWVDPEEYEAPVDLVAQAARLEQQRLRDEQHRAHEEAQRRPVTDEEFSAGMAAGDDATVAELLARQQRAGDPLRLHVLLRAIFEAGRLPLLEPFFEHLPATFTGDEQAQVAGVLLDAALVSGRVAAVLLDVDRWAAGSPLLAPFARRVFEAWRARPAEVANGLSPILYRLPSATFSPEEWAQIVVGAKTLRNEALVWRCTEHLKAAT